MIDELIFGMDLEGNGGVIIDVLSWNLSAGTKPVRVAYVTDSIRTKNLPRTGLQCYR
jgi:hypothetical protein